MRTVSVLCVGAAMMLGAIGAANADATSQTEGLAFEAIAAGNWSAAEAELRAGLTQTPNDPMKLLNLAYVLQKAGRADEAAGVYGQVLQLDRDPLVAVGPETKTRPMRAKLLAKKGMASLEK
jgi:Flp pilus assembly protein TadD